MRWARLQLEANGIDWKGKPADDVFAIAAILVATGRAIPIERWSDDVRHEGDARSFHCLM